MKKLLIFSMFVAGLAVQVQAQKYFTRDGHISFHSDAPLEKIEAHNEKVTSVLDIESGALEFAALIRSFHFEKALMEEHFNENYMESNTYPKATFKGDITNIDAIDCMQDGTYEAVVGGQLTIHGVTKPVETIATIRVTNGEINGTAEFQVAVADYNIEVPKVVRDNIAKVVQIKVDIDYKPLKS